MSLKKVFLIVFLSVTYKFYDIHAAKCNGRPNNGRPNIGRPALSLCQEFQKILNLAPQESVITLIHSHMANDIRFRKAIKYIKSPEFKKTTAKIDSTATFQNILKEFVDAGVNTADINSVGKIFDCLIMPLIDGDTGTGRSSSIFIQPDNMVEIRSLDTFAQEVARLIPTDELINTLEELVSDSAQFSAFYEVVREPSFRSKVMQGFINSDISRPIKTLRRQQIYLDKLVENAFNLLYLGPEV